MKKVIQKELNAGISFTNKELIFKRNEFDEATRSVDIIGEGNWIKADVENTLVVGNNNVIEPGVKNVVVIGDNIDVDGDFTLYAENLSIQGETEIQFTDKTYAELQALVAAEELAINNWYRITDYDIYIKAVSNNKFSNTGIRKYRVPVQIGYSAVLTNKAVFNTNVPQDVILGDTYIWGGKYWEVTTAGTGVVPDNNTTLPAANFTMIPESDDNFYEDLYLSIIYDFPADYLGTIFGLYGNIYSSNSDSKNIICDFNNPLIRNNKVYSIFNNSNTNNGARTISNNTNLGLIENNANTGDINGNSNAGNIINNSNVSSINSNSNSGPISGNDNFGFISNNSNGGLIENNTNDGWISNNSNNGAISGNSNNGDIDSNSNNGSIFNNSNSGDIRHNINNGQIFSNPNSVGDIFDTIVNK